MRFKFQDAIINFVLCASYLVLSFGCGGAKVEGPPTVPVKGRIEFTKGGKVQDLANNSILVEFQSIEKPELKAFGEILEDGTFTLSTQIEGKGKPGAVPGTHRVRLNADESAARFVSPKFLRHETSGITVKVPPEGELIIKVSK
jgi:hypothetical protein